MTDAVEIALAPVTVEFAGERYVVQPGEAFVIGREGDLAIDDNRFLHRHLLRLRVVGSLWWLENIGSRLSATVTDAFGRVQAWLAPGARIPLVFRAMSVIFTAGSTTYELTLLSDAPTFDDAPSLVGEDAMSTLGDVLLTPAQRVLIVALAEPMLRRDGVSMSDIPATAAAAARLGWSLTRFNRKLDNVCDKFTRAGVPGLHGGVRGHATNRRARLVEHAIAARLVTRADLPLLDEEHARNAADPLKEC
ncbi:hypothetical protein [Demequina iriomotensis]|uniref:hypothetical protein n=1 Tax=Demequina iriomotensis TaxID=1536641 RepID=UPI000A91D157|nr:hypothetical protein [Demequina iriomotensis]